MRERSEKVFGIGLSSTRTTSLTEAVKLLGYRSDQYGEPLSDLGVSNS